MQHMEATTYQPHIGQVVRRMREAADLSVIELAKNSGLVRQEVWYLETGKRPDPHLSLLNNISNGLGIKASTLLRQLEVEQEKS